MKKIGFLSLFLIISVFLAGCGNNEQDSTANNNEDTLTVYTTVYPLQDFTEKIGGEFVNVETIYPPGTDEHSYEPSQKDIVKMTNADLFFYIGHNLEGFVTKSKSILTDEGVQVIAVGEEVSLDEAADHKEAGEDDAHEEESHDESEHAQESEANHDEHDHGDVDPHLWLDPVYADQMAKIIKNELVAKMPEQEAYFEERYDKLSTQLTELDRNFAETIKTAKTKKIIVSHDAYGYWEKRYGLEQISVTGLSGAEPSQKDLEEIVKKAEENDLHYIIFEQNISSKLTEIIQGEIGAEPLHLHNLSVLTESDLENGSDYFSLMNQNLETLQTALN
jgi:zinc transport system substrate-binding protein